MSRFLQEITAAKRAEMSRVTAKQRAATREEALASASGREAHRFATALSRKDRINVIAEVKRSSPSVGAIRMDADVLDTVRTYEQAGAAAISVLTEPQYFGGSLDDLSAASAAVSVPLLRKDFIVDEHQIYEAAANGASAVLLIVAALGEDELSLLRVLAEEQLGLDALVEVHAEDEMETAIACGASIIGVNNRNLQTLQVSLDTSRQLAKLKAPGITLVSESGLRTRNDLVELRELGYDAFLMGEVFMRAGDAGATLRELVTAEVTP